MLSCKGFITKVDPPEMEGVMHQTVILQTNVDTPYRLDPQAETTVLGRGDLVRITRYDIYKGAPWDNPSVVDVTTLALKCVIVRDDLTTFRGWEGIGSRLWAGIGVSKHQGVKIEVLLKIADVFRNRPV